MSLVSQTNNTYVGSIQTPTDIVPNAIGLSPLDALGQSVSNIGKMVNYSNKAIYTNFIGKFDKIPIEVIDPINISNGLTIDGVSYTAGSSSSITTINNGPTTINILSTGGIQFAANSSIVININGDGGFQYNLSNDLSSPIFQVNGQLIASSFQLTNTTSTSVSSYFLQAIDALGNAQWATVPYLRNSSLQESLVFNGPSAYQQGFVFQTLSSLSVAGTQGYIDANSNWFVGEPDYIANADLIASNGVLVTSNLRLRGSEGSVGYVLQQTNIYGDIGWAPPLSTNLYITNQINCNLSTAVTAELNDISFAIKGGEVMRINSNGYLGIGTVVPQAGLDNAKDTVLRGGLKIPALHGTNASTGLVLTCIDSNGTVEWLQPIVTSIGSSVTTTVVVGNVSCLSILGAQVLAATTLSNLVASAGAATMTLDVSGNIIATSFQGKNGIQFLGYGSNTFQAIITPDGNMGIGTATPGATLEVAGNAIIDLALTVSNNITTGGSFVGDGSQIVNILPTNVGVGANQLSAFYTTTRNSLTNQSFLISTNYSTLFGLISSTQAVSESGIYSTLTSVEQINYISLSTLTNTVYLNLSSTTVNNFVTLSTVTQTVASNLSTAIGTGVGSGISNQLSTVSNGLYSTLSTRLGVLNTLVSTNFVSSIQYASTSVSRLSTLIGPGWYYTSSLIGLISTGSGGGGGGVYNSTFDYNYAAEIVINTLRAGIDFEQIVVGSQLPNPRSSDYVTTVVDISGSAIFGPDSRLYFSSGGGITIGHNTLNSTYGAIDVSGTIFASAFAGQSTLMFELGGAKVGEFSPAGTLTLGQSLSTAYQYQPTLDVSGNIELTGLLLKNGVPYNLTPILDLYWGKSHNNVFYTIGNVGIGTAVPQYTLDVAGDIRCKSLTIAGMRMGNLSSAIGQILSADTLWSTNGSKIFYTGGPVGIGAGNVNPLYTLDISGSALFRGGTAYFSTQVGVGFPANSLLNGALDVTGIVYADGFGGGYSEPLRFFVQEKEVARVGTDGRMMIGMSTQSAVGTGMDISGNVNVFGKLYQNGKEILTNTSNNWGYVGSNLVYIGGGNVGIGTTIPQKTLDVAGTIRCQALQIVKTVPVGNGILSTGTIIETTVFYMDSVTRHGFYADTGNIGIGISTPSARLTVIGDILATSTVTANKIVTNGLTFGNLSGLPNSNIMFNVQSGQFSTFLAGILLSTGSATFGPGTFDSISGTVGGATFTVAEGPQQSGPLMNLCANTIPSPSIYIFGTAVNQYIFTLPNGAASVDFSAWGAGGGAMYISSGNESSGGGGASVIANYTASAGTQFRVTIGAAGARGNYAGATPSGGGGLTMLEVWTGSWTILFIVGSGGGGGYQATGGAAAGSNTGFQGGNGSKTTNPAVAGIALGNTSGGGGGTSSGGSAGSSYAGVIGNAGAYETGGLPNSPLSSGAGGGAGYYGGGSGVSPGAGGGGSTYVNSGILNSFTAYDGSLNTAGNSSSPLYNGFGHGGSTGVLAGAGAVIFSVNYDSRTEPLLTIGEGLSSTSQTYFSIDRSGNALVKGNINILGSILQNGTVFAGGGWNEVGVSNTSFTGGYVGIGTASPQSILDVAGIIRCQGVRIISGSDLGPNTTETIVYPPRSGWSQTLLLESVGSFAGAICSTFVVTNTSSFVLATANLNLSNTTASTRVFNSYMTINGISSFSTVTSVSAGQTAGTSLSYRSYVGVGTNSAVLWSYADAGASLAAIRADVSATGNLL
jgi:hypothetical protein